MLVATVQLLPHVKRTHTGITSFLWNGVKVFLDPGDLLRGGGEEEDDQMASAFRGNPLTNLQVTWEPLM